MSKPSKTPKAARGRGLTIPDLVAGAVILAGAVVAGYGGIALSRADAVLTDRFAPGVQVGGVPVGGLTAAQAHARVRAWAQARLLTPVTLLAPVSGQRWSVTVGDLGGRYDIDSALKSAFQTGKNETAWQRLCDGPRTRNIVVSPVFHFREKGVDRELQRIARVVGRPATSARGRLSPTGGIEVTASETRGVALDVAATREALRRSAGGHWERGATASLVIREAKPALCAADLARVDTVLASFHTDFGSSAPNRRHNVELAAQHIDGTILAPGETFSYNDTVGPRTTKRGWLDAPTFLDGQVVPSPGGGVCQVSTTLYNAVLRAGLGIVQRSHHSMAVHYVEPGRDATVAYGNIDFRFRNTTPAPVLVAASTKGGRLTFSLYGAAPDAPQQISLASSAHTPRADGGFSVTTFRVVQRGEEPAVRETLSTDTYAPPPSKAHPTKPKPAPPRPIADKRLKSTPLLPSA